MKSIRDVRADLQALSCDLSTTNKEASDKLWEAVDALVDIEVELTTANELLKTWLRNHQ